MEIYTSQIELFAESLPAISKHGYSRFQCDLLVDYHI